MSALVQPFWGTPTALTITLASLANSATLVGRQSTLVDNTTDKFLAAIISLNLKLGTTPTLNGMISVYLLRSNNDGTAIIDDAAGTTDAGITIINAPLIGRIRNPGTTTGQVLKLNIDTWKNGNGLILPPKWALGIVNNTGVAFDATGGNQVATYMGYNPQIN